MKKMIDGKKTILLAKSHTIKISNMDELPGELVLHITILLEKSAEITIMHDNCAVARRTIWGEMTPLGRISYAEILSDASPSKMAEMFDVPDTSDIRKIMREVGGFFRMARKKKKKNG